MADHDPRILIHEDIKALAKQAYELAQLPEPERAARKWEAVAVCGQIVSAATPAGLTAAQTALEARWGAQIRAQGLAALTICPHTATASHLRAARSGSGSCASS